MHTRQKAFQELQRQLRHARRREQDVRDEAARKQAPPDFLALNHWTGRQVQLENAIAWEQSR